MTEIKDIAGLRRELKSVLERDEFGLVTIDFVFELIDSLEAGLRKGKRLLPFDTQNRPSILDKCGRCGHTFKVHNLSCFVDGCDCSEFMIEVIELRRVLSGSETPKKGLGGGGAE